MPSLKAAFVGVSLTVVFVSSSPSAKCVRRETFYCVPATFVGERAEYVIGQRRVCLGDLKLKGKSVSVALADSQCPAVGAKLYGQLGYLCQDTGQWTTAEYTFKPVPEQLCTRSSGEALGIAKGLAAKVTVGMTRDQVRGVLSELPQVSPAKGWSSEEYLVMPDVIIAVTFDEPAGRYSGENPVKGKVEVSRRSLPQP